MSDYIHIGTIVAARGLAGEMILVHEMGRQLTRENIPVLFIEKNSHNFIPYFVESIQGKNDKEVYLRLETVTSKETAQTLLKKKAYLAQEAFNTLVGPDSDLYYLGFTLVDAKEKELGKIVEISRLPTQLIAHVDEKGNELLIPLTPQTIERIDRKKKIVFVTLPAGLTDIYRQKNPDQE